MCVCYVVYVWHVCMCHLYVYCVGIVSRLRMYVARVYVRYVCMYVCCVCMRVMYVCNVCMSVCVLCMVCGLCILFI